MGMPAMPPMAGQGQMPQGEAAPPMGGEPSLQDLWAGLPPHFQAKLDPNNPITKLHFARLRKLTEQQGDALLTFIGKATPDEIKAFKAAFPELDMLLDLFDDGEINNSVGAGADDMGIGGDMGMEDEEDMPMRSRLDAVMA